MRVWVADVNAPTRCLDERRHILAANKTETTQKTMKPAPPVKIRRNPSPGAGLNGMKKLPRKKPTISPIIGPTSITAITLDDSHIVSRAPEPLPIMQ